MNVFNWNPLFETGIELIDVQHRRLVDIINRLGDAVISRGVVGSADSEAVYGELSDYALRHFSDEERLMTAAGVDAQYFEHHQLKHREFVDELRALHDRPAGDHESASELLGFLAGWLTFHILDEDQAMVGRIRAARSRNAVVTENREVADAKANAVLLASMRVLYRALADSNARLEVQVRERTRDLLQAEKMAAIGQLAAGVAHEINNPLGFVVSNLGTLGQWTRDLLGAIDFSADWCGDCPELKPKLDAINRNANLPILRSELGTLLAETQDGLKRVRDIVRALQGFADESSDGIRDFDLLEGLESTLGVVAGSFTGRIELVRELSPMPPIRCVPSAINHVFMNLLLNAAAAIPARGVITVRSGSSDDEVWVEVADSGCGIRAEHLPRIFEPFFTTRPIGHGMGLGLTTAWDTVVNKHAGQIDVRSTPDAGSSFTVRLPRRASAGNRAAAVQEPRAEALP